MGQPITKQFWRADDGKVFDTEQAMRAHEARSTWLGLIQDYCDSLDFGGYANDRAAKSAQTRIETSGLPLLGYLASKGLLSPQAEAYSRQVMAKHAPPPAVAA